MTTQEPRQTSIYVRKPAPRFFMPRSMPRIPPKRTDRTIRMAISVYVKSRKLSMDRIKPRG